jgi:RNA polymerase sigma-70 factor (ECF subfamily)
LTNESYMNNHSFKTKEICEKDLVTRLVNNDKEAFSELYANYKDRLIFFAMKIVKSRDIAEDIFQDVFSFIWQYRHFINPEHSFSSYLYTIVKNKALNKLREVENEKNMMEAILSESIDYNNVTSHNILYNELREIIEKAINHLTPRQKEIFQMSRKELMSHQEIANKLNISLYTVQEHTTLALKSIRSYLIKNSGEFSSLILVFLCLNL